MQKTFGRDLNLEIGYLGSKNTHLGLPESNLNQLPAADLALGTALTVKVPNPYFGQIPASSSLGQPTIAQQQLLRAFRDSQRSLSSATTWPIRNTKRRR